MTQEGKPRELIISKDPLKQLKESLEKEVEKGLDETKGDALS